MLMLLFRVGDSRYAIPAGDVIEVTPYVELQPLAKTPDYVAGLCNYRNQHVPVIDLCRLVENRCCSQSLTTRIILVCFPTDAGDVATLGLLAEGITETIRIADNDFSGTGVHPEEAPFLGEAARVAQGLVHKITVGDLLPTRVKSMLFRAPV